MTEPVSIRLAPPGERHRDVPVPSEGPWAEYNEALAAHLALAQRADEAREEFNQTLADEFVELVRSNREEWGKVLDERIAAARDEEVKARQLYLAAARQRVSTEALREFIASFPAAKSFRPVSPRISGLVRPSGEPYTLDDVEHALEESLAQTA